MIIRKEEFCKWIEVHRSTSKQSYIDSVLDACEYFKVQEELVKDLLNNQIILKLEAEAKDLNFIRKTETSLKDFI